MINSSKGQFTNCLKLVVIAAIGVCTTSLSACWAEEPSIPVYIAKIGPVPNKCMSYHTEVILMTPFMIDLQYEFSKVTNKGIAQLIDSLGGPWDNIKENFISKLVQTIQDNLSITQIDYWEGLSIEEIQTHIFEDSLYFKEKLWEAHLAFEESDELSNYLPRLEISENGASRQIYKADLCDSISSYVTDNSARISQEITACLMAWDNWQDSMMTVSMMKYNSDLSTIAGIWYKKLAYLVDFKTDLSSSIESNYNASQSGFMASQMLFESNLNQIVSQVSVEKYKVLRSLNNLLFAFNIQQALKAYTMDTVGVNTRYEISYDILKNSVDSTTNVSYRRYKDCDVELDSIVEFNTRECRDQGGI